LKIESLGLPYITRDLQGIGGVLRATTDHFQVEEIPLYSPCGEGTHLYVNLTREGLTTRDVQRRLAMLFGGNDGAVGFAGMKDKYARTTQTFSINVGKVERDFIEQATTRIRSQLPVTVNWADLHRNKLKLGHLRGNRFTITVTDFDPPADEALDRVRTIAALLIERGMPNFFGPQRFGGDNLSRGLAIIQGKYREGEVWLRRLLVSSYLGFLCNLYLTRRIELGLFDRILTGDIAKKYDTGGLFVVEDGSAEQQRYESHEISFTAPIYGSKMWKAEGASGEIESDILAESGITLEQMDRLGVRGTRRLGRLLPDDLSIGMVDDGLIVRFSLPKGAYATTVMREIMKVDVPARDH